MKKFLISITLLLNSCSGMPQIASTIDDIATDNAVKIELSREAIQKQKDITISVDIKNNIQNVK